MSKWEIRGSGAAAGTKELSTSWPLWPEQRERGRILTIAFTHKPWRELECVQLFMEFQKKGGRRLRKTAEKAECESQNGKRKSWKPEILRGLGGMGEFVVSDFDAGEGETKGVCENSGLFLGLRRGVGGGLQKKTKKA